MVEREPERPDEAAIVHNSQERRFEATIDGELAQAAYVIEGETITFTHTEVPTSSRGQGVGDNLAFAAFEYARNNDLTVVPACRFMSAYLEHHKEYADLVKKRPTAP